MTPIDPKFMETLRLQYQMQEQGALAWLKTLDEPRSIFRAADFIEAANFMASELRNPPAVPDARTADGQPLTCIEPLAIRLGVEDDDIPRMIRFFSYDGLAYPVN